MTEDLLRQRLAECHQEDGPVNRVEADNVLSDQMQIRRPVLLIELSAVAVRIIAYTCRIVGQGVEPDIDHMTRRKVDRNSPVKAGARHAEILQTRLQEIIHHLVLSGDGLNKLRMLFNVLNQAIRILAHAEKVGLLRSRLHLSAASRALAVDKLRLGPEALTRCTVEPLIGTLVNISLLIELFENLLYLLLVVRFGGTHKAIVGRVHEVPDTLNFRRYLVDIRLRRHTGIFCLALNLLTVLVCSGLKIYVIALFALKAGNCVRQNNLIGISDVRLAGSIGNRRRDIVGFSDFFSHSQPPHILRFLLV